MPQLVPVDFDPFAAAPEAAQKTTPVEHDPFAGKPEFGSPEYVNALAKKHGADSKFVKGLVESQTATEGLKGIPIIGGAVEKAGAGVSALAAPLTGAGAPGASVGERYGKNLDLEKEIGADFEAAHPNLSTAAQLAGGTAATLPLGATALGARALGLTGATLPAQIAAGAASGAGINAADALVRGQDPLTAGAVGGSIGGALPAAGRIAGAIAQPAVNAVRGFMNPADEAARLVAGAVQRDVRTGTAGLSEPEFHAAQAAGAPTNLMDLGGETTRALARSAANTSPEGRALLNRSIDDRFESQSGRLTDWLNRTFHYPDAPAQQRAIDQVERTTNRAAYDRAHEAGSGGVWSPELERLTSSPAIVEAMQGAAERGSNRAVASGLGGFNPGVTFENGVMNFRRGPTGAPVYPDLRFWDYTQRNLRDASQAAFRQGKNEEGGALASLHRSLLGELDTAVPEFQVARAGAARFFGAENALQAGQEFVTSRMENGAARTALAQMSQQERQLFQDGFVDRLMRQIGESRDRRSVITQIAQSPAARERLNIALGPHRSNELQAMLHVENIMDLARGAVQGNSTTARQLTELGLAGGAGTLLGGGNPLDPASIMNAALAYGALRGRTAIDTRVSHQVARLLTSDNPQQLANGMRILARNQNLLGALRNADVALARTGTAQTNTGPAPTAETPTMRLMKQIGGAANPPPPAGPAQQLGIRG